MPEFAIIETEDGFAVVELREGVAAVDAAAEVGGMVIDPGPYKSYDEAFEAMQELPIEGEEEEDEAP